MKEVYSFIQVDYLKMDGYYQAQVDMPYFKGSARQPGRGLGTMALKVGRTALPILKKYIIPAAKRFGKSLLENAGPEMLEIASGNVKPRQALKRVVGKSVRAQVGGGAAAKKKARKRGGVGKKRGRRRKRVGKPKQVTRKKRKPSIRKRKPTKLSRSDILGQLM